MFRGGIMAEEIIIEEIGQLEQYAIKSNNRRLLGVIYRLKYSQQIEEQVVALASIIQSLRKKGIKYTEHFVRHCLLYILQGVER